jgi:serine protease inhibitor
VEEKTKQKIKDLIKEDMLSSQVKMVLVNAIYFKGSFYYIFMI